MSYITPPARAYRGLKFKSYKPLFISRPLFLKFLSFDIQKWTRGLDVYMTLQSLDFKGHGPSNNVTHQFNVAGLLYLPQP